MPLPPLSLQSSTLQNLYDLDTQADYVLDRLQAIDIHAIEGGGRNAADFGGKLQARAMRYSGTHTAISGDPQPAKFAADLNAMGGRDLINSGILKWNSPTTADFRSSAARLNEFGQALANDGIHMHYHNHAFEFEWTSSGERGFDILLEELDPKVWGLCVDLAWVWRSGIDPAQFLRRHANRITYLHLKDTDESDWFPIGRGKLQWRSIFDEIAQLPFVRWAAIEQDIVTGDPWIAINESRQFLASQFGW